MVHLVLHLVGEARLCGPVYLRWMYPNERYMKILKVYVKNHYRPKASMIERYIAKENIEFCIECKSNRSSSRLIASQAFYKLMFTWCTCGKQILIRSLAITFIYIE